MSHFNLKLQNYNQLRIRPTLVTRTDLSISSVCSQIDGQGHDLEVDLFLARVEDHPHDDGDAVRVGEHALHLVLQAEMIEDAANWILNFRICHQIDQFRKHSGLDHACPVVRIKRQVE